jgi:hypothetical protein
MLIGATNPSWITSEVQALERVALTAPITKRKISRLLSIHLFKKGPTSTTEKIIVSPNVNVSIAVRFYDICCFRSNPNAVFFQPSAVSSREN